jgi:hypothetical protein
VAEEATTFCDDCGRPKESDDPGWVVVRVRFLRGGEQFRYCPECAEQFDPAEVTPLDEED